MTHSFFADRCKPAYFRKIFKTEMKYLVLYICLLIPMLSNGQKRLHSVEEAMQLARNNNSDLQISNNKNAIESVNVRTARSALLPQVKAVSNFDYNYALPVQLIPAEFLGGKPSEYRSVQFGTKYAWTAGMEASLPLVSASLWADARIASLNREAAMYNAKNIEFETMKQVTRGYYMNLLSLLSLDISGKNFGVADSLKRSAEHKYQNGLIEPLEYNRILTVWYRAKNDVESASSVLYNNNNALKYYLGMEQTDSLVVSGNMQASPPLLPLTATTDSYPSVKEKQILATAALWNLKKEKYRRLPEISMYGKYLAQAQRNAFNFFDKSRPWYSIGVAGLRFEMPLFTGFIRSGNIRRLEYRYDIQQRELEKEKERASMEDKELLAGLRNAAYSAANLSESFGLSEQNIKIAYFKYEQGLFGLDQYLNVLNESLSIQGQYVKALSDLYTSKTILDLKNNLQ